MMGDELLRTRLARLPRALDRPLEGDVRVLSTLVDTGSGLAQPSIALWVDGASGHVRAHSLFIASGVPEDEVREATRALLDALTNPSPTSGTVALYGRVRVSRHDLADAARALLPEEVTIEVMPSLPAVDEAFLSFEEFVDSQSGPFSWEGDPALFKRLFTAAAGYARRAPWTYLEDVPPLTVSLPPPPGKRKARTLYGCVLGAAGLVRGIAFYLTRAGLERAMDTGGELLDMDALSGDGAASLFAVLLERAGISPDDPIADEIRSTAEEMIQSAGDAPPPPMEDSLTLFFLDPDEEDPRYLAWVEERGLPVHAPEGAPMFTRVLRRGEPRQPNEEETRTLALAIEAVNGFLTRYRRRLADPLTAYQPATARITLTDGENAEVHWPGP